MKNISEILAKMQNPLIPKMEFIELSFSDKLRIFEHIANALIPDYIIDQGNEDVINNLILYFTGNNRSEYDLSKGIMLHGEVGTGKTKIMEILKIMTAQIFKVNSFRVNNSVAIENDCLMGGIEKLTNYTTGTLLIDDVGFEKGTINFFGTNIEIISELLTTRYRLYDAGYFTHITSNLTASGIEKRYGKRVLSRLRETMNDVHLGGPDRRK